MSLAPSTAAPVQPWRAVTVATVAEIGALVGDQGRACMLSALLDGRALTARELADCAAVTPQTASSHLAKLVDAGLVHVERVGRHRYHRLASPDVAQVLEALYLAGSLLAPGRGARRTGPADQALRRARSCYDHIAGRLGVALADALISRGCVTLQTSGTELTRTGRSFFEGWGVDVDAVSQSRRPLCRTCLDWSERRPHLAGALGEAMLDRALALGWLRRCAGVRALDITPKGQLGFGRVFGVERL